jgi:hypothetical protein
MDHFTRRPNYTRQFVPELFLDGDKSHIKAAEKFTTRFMLNMLFLITAQPDDIDA